MLLVEPHLYSPSYPTALIIQTPKHTKKMIFMVILLCIKWNFSAPFTQNVLLHLYGHLAYMD